MAAPARSARVQELSGAAAGMLLVGFVGSGWVGWALTGITGAFFGALAVTTVLGTALGLKRMRATDRTDRGKALPDLASLPPEQALVVMGAMLGDGAAAGFRSELVLKLEKIDRSLEADPQTALDSVRPFLKDHPRSPAVHLRLARCHRALADDGSAAGAVTAAIERALDGGMNKLAAQIFDEFEALGNALSLSQPHRSALARALRQHGFEDHARRLVPPSDAS